MNDAITRAAERAITTMHERLSEPVTVDDMARAAMFSKFHFTRMFQRATGVSPARFLSALRLQRAKHLLTSTTMTVVDISVLVGYNSVGTFSSRFSRSVGLSPTDYRRRGGHTDRIRLAEPRGSASGAATVSGVIEGHDERRGLVFAGLFPECVPEGRPVCCTILDGPGSYRFDNVPTGRWYLLAQSAVEDDGAASASGSASASASRPGRGRFGAEATRGGESRNGESRGGESRGGESRGAESPVWVGTLGPIIIRRGVEQYVADLPLKPAGVLDPPVLLALQAAREEAVERAAAAASAASAASATSVRAGVGAGVG
ncbi:helix-turn-helix domain-containing protein [Catenulispora rubra]|uniref:helix-turn-helix domain-containing protein n=1 Tax=Catenulispora rubra TaxID=280293 RepID=UPI0018922DE7|nr:AraC family transcriptional regulator [Catenulispora rubra]